MNPTDLGLHRNVTFFTPPPSTYWAQFDKISKTDVSLNLLEKIWEAWYSYMQDDVLATGIMSFMLHEIAYFGRCGMWTLLDTIPYFSKYKIQNQKMPSPEDHWKCIRLVLLCHFITDLPQLWLLHPAARYFGLTTRAPFPSLFPIIYQVAIFMVIEDTYHYWMHRLLHWGPLYKRIHKAHHTFSAPFGLAAEYASPLEVLLMGSGTIWPPLVWCMLTGDLHLLTVYIWGVLRTFQTIDAHSGYDFPWSLHHFIPFWAGADHHDMHHEYFVGNYASSFRWWDYLLNTQSGPEAAVHRVQRKKKIG